jgi:hypothetical protein
MTDQWLPEDVWQHATDPRLPPGVVAFQDDAGLWWRYPLIEFVDAAPHRPLT